MSRFDAGWDDVTDKVVDSASVRAVGAELAELVAEKQAAYGDSFTKAAEILQVLYPEGVRPESYRDMLAVVRIVDKLGRIANAPDAFGESPYMDIAGYGLVAEVKHRRDKTKEHMP